MLDIHTHKKIKEKQLLSLFAQDLPSGERFISSGIHPWHLNYVEPELLLEKLDNAANENKIIAIGECGIDKSIDTSPDYQIEIFTEQLKIAEKYNLPVILHCVKGYSELLEIRKSFNKTAWIVHGFNSTIEMAESLINKNIYLSFGTGILFSNRKAAKTLSRLKPESIFLETDDSEVDISEIYGAAANILKINIEELIKIIENNFIKCFGMNLNE